MDVSLAIRQRLDELGLEQRALARAAQVTESYISQLLTGRRVPPAPNRTDIYDKMDKVLKLPQGELAKLAAHQRKEQIKRELGDEPAPMFGEVRELILRKCHAGRVRTVRAIFEKEPFGDLERLVTKTIVDLIKRIAKEQLDNEQWLATAAKLAGRSLQDIRGVAVEFLDTDLLNLSPKNCVAFLDPLIEIWDIDLAAFEIAIYLHPRVSPTGAVRRFRFSEQGPAHREGREPGFEAFMKDASLSGSATEREIAFLESLRFNAGRPTALYFYRELQSLRDPLHFRAEAPELPAAKPKGGEPRSG